MKEYNNTMARAVNMMALELESGSNVDNAIKIVLSCYDVNEKELAKKTSELNLTRRHSDG